MISRCKILSRISTLLKMAYCLNTMHTLHSGASSGGLNRGRRMGIVVILSKHLATPPSSIKKLDREQSRNFLVILVTNSRTQISALSTSLSALSLQPAVRQSSRQTLRNRPGHHRSSIWAIHATNRLHFEKTWWFLISKDACLRRAFMSPHFRYSKITS